MLDEECLLPHGTDNGFVALLESHTQVQVSRTEYSCVFEFMLLRFTYNGECRMNHKEKSPSCPRVRAARRCAHDRLWFTTRSLSFHHVTF